MKDIKVKEIYTNNYVTKSKLPSADYVINPYVGCTNACKYCYASFMKRFTGHTEAWGDFIDVKKCDKEIDTKKLINKTVLLSSVTDCYNELEEKYMITRNILNTLKDVDCNINISTKSSLVLRDIDILKKCKNLLVSIYINTLDENFKNDMDNAPSINGRLNTLKELKQNGIYTVLFMSPIFPYITEVNKIIETSKEYVDEYWFENLKLRGRHKTYILNYIKEKYNKLYDKYIDIYVNNNKEYWKKLSCEIDEYCIKNNIKYVNYFYHDEIKKK